jgi:hypothetical protein
MVFGSDFFWYGFNNNPRHDEAPFNLYWAREGGANSRLRDSKDPLPYTMMQIRLPESNNNINYDDELFVFHTFFQEMGITPYRDHSFGIGGSGVWFRVPTGDNLEYFDFFMIFASQWANLEDEDRDEKHREDLLTIARFLNVMEQDGGSKLKECYPEVFERNTVSENAREDTTTLDELVSQIQDLKTQVQALEKTSRHNHFSVSWGSVCLLIALFSVLCVFQGRSPSVPSVLREKLFWVL